ncbi:PIN domain-containing protein [Comamonas flocculans]|uniref:Type II toxin-antitoxin system VapC family toxin n=1 Tax=Comamonas flocculans TaxID=2597701 RepID=A0A5B8RVR3_9BURK|nr:type II toxin-antitoxin system VapC family toxin [Comamonas flocculans]QEA13223.1 type II toxin-antitoxin system VapC family toxin [Comamonas flocculans]
MIGLDTNVLVRYIMQDDAAQSAKATALIESLDSANPGFVGMVVIAELYWVLSSCYALGAGQFQQALQLLVQSRQIVVENADTVLRALRAFAGGKADFPDCLIACAAASAGCARTVSFDVKATRHAGMSLLA